MRTPRHDHHNLDHGGPLKGVPEHDHTGPGNGGTLPPVDLGGSGHDHPCCPPDPPFVQTCTEVNGTLVQSAGQSNTSNITFGADLTVGNLCILGAAIGATVTGVAPHAGWSVASDLIIPAEGQGPDALLGLPGGPGQMWWKILEASDLGSFLGGSDTVLLVAPPWSGSGENFMFAWEIAGLGSTPTITSVGNSGDRSAPRTITAGPIGTTGFTVGMGWTGGNVIAGQSVTGWTEETSADAGSSGPRGWVGSAVGIGDTTLSLDDSVNAYPWGGIVVNATVGDSVCTRPTLGQSIWPEIGEGSGLVDSQQTNYDYRAGAIHVYLSGVHVAPVETDPASGIWEWPTDVIPEAGETWVVYYRTEFGNATGAGNDLASPTSNILRPSNVVNGSGPLTVGSSWPVVAQGDHGPHLTTDSIDDEIALLRWEPHVSYDGTVVLDSGLNPVMQLVTSY